MHTPKRTSDTFTLSFAQLAGDNFDLTGVAIYADANGDGIPDNTTAITTTTVIPAGSSFKFVVVGNAPATATDASTSRLQVNAASVFTPAVTAANIDTASVSANAVISLTKSVNVPSGNSPSGPYTFTLLYNNTGNSPASSLTIMDIIPAGMTYVAGSGRWSGAGATPLTDALGGDPAGILFDYDVTRPGQVTATISTVAPGQSGSLTFQVNINANLGPGAINNVATYTYDPGTGTTVGPFNSNTSQFSVNQVASVTISGQTIATATQGSTVAFTNLVTNTGNGVDSFDITVGTSSFPPGTTFALFQADGTTPLLDSNNNGIPGTGPIAPGGTYTVVLRATLPSTVSTGGPFSVQKIARSVNDPTKSATTTDTLNSIVANTVDLTNDSPGAGAPGAGTGPEASPVRTISVNPGSTARFTLYVNNTSSVADVFSLTASTDASFTSTLFPAGWTVIFRDSVGAVITSTGVLPPGGSKLVYADVTVPTGFAPGTYSGYFRAMSPTTGAMDRKLDAVVVNVVRNLKLEPNNTGQVSPGGSVVYSHFISNEGNVVEGDGTVSTVLTLVDSQVGFTSVVYWDQNNNGVLDATDPVINDLSTLSGGLNAASTAPGLDPGERARLFVKVFAPVGAAAGTVDTTILTATTTGGVGTVPPVISVNDITSVISGDIIGLKEQALDSDCDGVPNNGFATANVTAGVRPGACIRYRITVTNNGSAPAVNVVVNDSTPAYTVYSSTVPATTTKGTIEATPADGATGQLRVRIGTLNPGESAVVTFGVRITN